MKPLLLLPLSLALLSGSLLSQVMPREQLIDAVREFKRFFKKYPKPAQRVEAVMSLESIDCPEAVHALTPLLRHKEPDIQKAAKLVLSGYKAPETYKAVLEGLPELTDREMRAQMFDVISRAGQVGLKSTMKQIWDASQESLTVAEKYYMARAYGALGAELYEDIIGTLTEDRAYQVRLAALDTARTSKLKGLGPKLLGLLDDPVWQVQAAAIKCVGRLRTMEAVVPLIAFLEKEGRLKKDAANALFEITARDFGTDHAAWEKQWKFLTSIKGFRLPTEVELEKARKTRAKADKNYKLKKGDKAFAGIPTNSTRVIFIIDVSASMDDLVVDRQKFRAGNYPSFRKIDIVKTELLRTINGLNQHTHFNILAFAKKVKGWKRWLTPGTINYKASAISFVKRMQPLGVAKKGMFGATGDDSGKTNTHAALMRAFDLDPAKGVSSTAITGGKKSVRKALKLDTIYFLTDGRPTVGKFVDTEDILKEVGKINEVRGIVIHTISIGEFEASFMRRLAENNGGVFVNLGG